MDGPAGAGPPRSFDLIVVGGGIIGSGVARDAALRGLRVALVEQHDVASGTTAASTRLIHGGLRYLEHLDFGLVRQDLAERELLLRNAAHLVRPLPFLVPIYRRGRRYRARLRAGMILYDLLSYDRSLPGHRFLSADAARRREPALNPDGLEGAALYYDAQVELAERLGLENVRAAVEAGAVAHTYTRVAAFARDAAAAVTGVVARDLLDGRDLRLTAPVVVNAAGPWLDDLLARLDPAHRPLLRRTKGIHLATPPVTRDAVVLFAESDNRLFFVIPWLGYSFVGTTDTDFSGDPAAARAEPDEIAYLLAEVGQAFPTASWHPIAFTTAGVRALVRREGVAAGAVSRKHRLVDHATRGAPGLISIVGGKLTAYRAIAEEVVDLVCRRLGVIAPGRTRARPLPGAAGFGPATLATARRDGQALGLAADQAEHLATLYGARYAELLDLVADAPRLAARLDPAAPACLAQVHHAVRREGARTVSDVVRRRTTLGFRPDQGLSVVDRVAAEMAPLLDWDAARQAAEVDAYRREVASRRSPVASGRRARVSGQS